MKKGGERENDDSREVFDNPETQRLIETDDDSSTDTVRETQNPGKTMTPVRSPMP